MTERPKNLWILEPFPFHLLLKEALTVQEPLDVGTTVEYPPTELDGNEIARTSPMPQGRITHSQKINRLLLGDVFDVALPFNFRSCLCCRPFYEGTCELQQFLACHFDFEARTFSRLNEYQKICHFTLTLNPTSRRSYDKRTPPSGRMTA